jgi:elongation factor Ts
MSAELVKQLREITGAGIMECKKALEEAGNEIEKAIDILKQKGVVKAAKKADRDTTEGRIGVALSTERNKLSYVKLGCETDFVAKNSEFIALADKIAKIALDKNTTSPEALLAEKVEGGTVDDMVKAAIAKIGENIKINGVDLVKADKGILEYYAHLGSKLVVVVEILGDNGKKDSLVKLAHELALQIAMDNPEFVCRDQVPADVVQREKDNLMVTPDIQSKPEGVRAKVVEGKLSAFFETCCLLDLPYIREQKKKVSEVVADAAKETGSKVDIVCFKRVSIGK